MKYYTPEIEEFHVGFEYESEERDGTYTKLTLSIKDSLEFIDDRSFEFRVKYLDREDIESLGFVCTGEPSCDNYLKITQYEQGNFILTTIENLNGIPEPISVGISHVNDKATWSKSMITIFNGELKNKSELKKLLIQLDMKKELNLE